jgi:hypothetical protein
MGRPVVHVSHQPLPVCLESGSSRWLVGVVGLGGGAAPAPPRGAWGASSIRVPGGRPARCRKAMRGVFGLAPLFPGGPGGTKPLLFTTHKPSQNVQEETHSCARDQVVIARPPVLTHLRRYRRSLVSKGALLYSIFINVICVGICSSLPKRRYCVVIDYVGDPLRHRGKVWCWKTSSCLWVFVVVASD